MAVTQVYVRSPTRYAGSRPPYDRIGAASRLFSNTRCMAVRLFGSGVISPRSNAATVRNECGEVWPRLVQAVEAHRAAGEDALLRRGRCALQPLAHHVGRAGEETVAMRVVGCPHD